MDEYNHHILSQLYVDDYCIWIQHVKWATTNIMKFILSIKTSNKIKYCFRDEILTKLANEVRKVSHRLKSTN